jgi:hypothetical protein
VPKAGRFSTPGVTASAPAWVNKKKGHQKSQKKRFNTAFEGKKAESMLLERGREGAGEARAGGHGQGVMSSRRRHWCI